MSAGGVTAPLLPFTTTTTTTSTSGNNQPPAGDSSSSSPINPSILTIVLILSATVILSVSLCLLLRHLNRRCLLHLSSSSSSVSPEDPTPPPPAAAFSFLDSLPVFTFASVKQRSSSSSEGDCAVCLSKFEGEDRLRLLPLCCHAFHVECIDTWLSSNQTCPLCRSPLFASEISDLLSRRSSSTSFRIEIGSVSRRRPDPAVDPSHGRQRSYSMGSSLDYVVDGEYSEVTVEKEEEEAEEEGRSISWLRDYVERLSSRAMSFRSSGRWFFTGSSRRSSDHDHHNRHHREGEEADDDDDDDVIRNYVGDDLEAATRATGDHISEMFRWFSAL